MSRSTAPPLDNAAARFSLPSTAAAPRLMRSLVSALLVTVGRPHLADDARLCVSELTTNVRRHTATPAIHLDVTAHPGRVAVAVWDDSGDIWPSTLPATRDRRDPGEHGRGLLLVHRLAATWGVAWPVPRDRGRKTVWFDLDDGPYRSAS
ncbi:ATP-binding protein [Streptomyces sp. BBFR102]|uniref:ATP-binding protein n=1 Tax=Streptomyces sp. BBFR102 TaxID=3448171 RepID=UPI003F53E01A